MPTRVKREGEPVTRAGTIMNGLAVLILVVMGVWGLTLYPQLPETIPTHWNASGEADAFSQKSAWSAFGVLIVAALMVLGMLALRYFLGRSSGLVPAERSAYDRTFGYLNLSLAAMFGWIAVMAWYDLQLGPWFVALSLLGGVPVLLILGLHLPAITKQRKEIMDPAEPSQDPKHWVLGGLFYSNAEDPRVWVPKPPHTGVGMTANLGSLGGRLIMTLLGVILVATLALAFLL